MFGFQAVGTKPNLFDQTSENQTKSFGFQTVGTKPNFNRTKLFGFQTVSEIRFSLVWAEYKGQTERLKTELNRLDFRQCLKSERLTKELLERPKSERSDFGHLLYKCPKNRFIQNLDHQVGLFHCCKQSLKRLLDHPSSTHPFFQHPGLKRLNGFHKKLQNSV